MKLSQLVGYDDALFMGKLEANVTESGITLKGRIRPTRHSEFGLCVTQLLRQLAADVDDDQVSGFVADVMDRTLAHGSLGETGRVRLLTANEGGPTLPARQVLLAVADRIASRWPQTPE